MPASHPRAAVKRRSAGRAYEKEHDSHSAASAAAVPSLLSWASLEAGLPAPFGLVALAAGKHPFPSRTRPLRLHAVMILRPGAWESNAPPILILTASPAFSAGEAVFFLRGLKGREVRTVARGPGACAPRRRRTQVGMEPEGLGRACGSSAALRLGWSLRLVESLVLEARGVPNAKP